MLLVWQLVVSTVDTVDGINVATLEKHMLMTSEQGQFDLKPKAATSPACLRLSSLTLSLCLSPQLCTAAKYILTNLNHHPHRGGQTAGVELSGIEWN